MVMYLSIVFVCMGLIMGLNILFGSSTFGYTPWQVVGLVCFSVVAQIVIDLLLAGIIAAMPDKSFNPDKKIFQVSKKERKFYEKLGIKKWKDKVLELGILNGFRKNKLRDGSNPDYLHKFMVETNRGVWTHILNMVFGVVVIFCLPLKYWLVISVPVTIVNIFLGLLPTFILRYNYPKLKAAYERAIRVRKQKEKETIV